MRKQTLIIAGIVLGLFIVAGVLWIPGYDRAGVHPVLLDIEEPLQAASTWCENDPAGLYLRLTDARGKAFLVFLPTDRISKTTSYSQFVAGDSFGALADSAKHPCSDDSRKFLAKLIDKYADNNSLRHFSIQQLRNAPVDRLRKWWFFKSGQEVSSSS